VTQIGESSHVRRQHQPPTAMNSPTLPPRSEAETDLRALIGADALLALTLNAAQTLATRPAHDPTARPNPRMMLTLLTFSYASGWFGSEDVERAAGTDPTGRYISAREDIRAADVRRFRRANRPWIEHCLTQVIAQVWLRASQCPEFRDPAGAARHAVILEAALRNARRRLSLAVQLDAAESE
jgi:hypothetical protein